MSIKKCGCHVVIVDTRDGEPYSWKRWTARLHLLHWPRAFLRRSIHSVSTVRSTESVTVMTGQHHFPAKPEAEPRRSVACSLLQRLFSIYRRFSLVLVHMHLHGLGIVARYLVLRYSPTYLPVQLDSSQNMHRAPLEFVLEVSLFRQ